MVVTKPEDNEDQTAIADKPGEGGHGERRPESRILPLRPWTHSRGAGQAGDTRPFEEGQVWEHLKGCVKGEVVSRGTGCGPGGVTKSLKGCKPREHTAGAQLCQQDSSLYLPGEPQMCRATSCLAPGGPF